MKNRVAVIGSGTMGNGIAHVFAQNGFSVALVDVVPQALEKAMQTISKNLDRMVNKGTITSENKAKTLGNITTHSDFTSISDETELAVEAATENMEVKFNIFRELDKITPPACILASNTSSISITKIASVTKRPSQIIGMHFMNPVPVMKLVEIIRGYKTSDEVTRTVVEISKQLGKIPVEVNDYPGFIANRILMPMLNEAVYALYEGVAGVEEIDTVMKHGMSHPMGPLQLADFIGLDVCLAILKVLHEGLGNPKYASCPLLVNMVNAGNLGVKSGEGFYSWTHGGKELVVAERFQHSRS